MNLGDSVKAIRAQRSLVCLAVLALSSVAYIACNESETDEVLSDFDFDAAATGPRDGAGGGRGDDAPSSNR